MEGRGPSQRDSLTSLSMKQFNFNQVPKTTASERGSLHGDGSFGKANGMQRLSRNHFNANAATQEQKSP